MRTTIGTRRSACLKWRGIRTPYLAVRKQIRRGIASRNIHHRLTKSSCRPFTGRISPPTGACLPPLTVGLRSKRRNFREYGFMIGDSCDPVFKSFKVTRSRDSLQFISLLECSVKVFRGSMRIVADEAIHSESIDASNLHWTSGSESCQQEVWSRGPDLNRRHSGFHCPPDRLSGPRHRRRSTASPSGCSPGSEALPG
jgi:hypothetical protein